MVGGTGLATDTTIGSGGSQYVWYNGTATDTQIADGGVQTIESGGVATSTNIADGGSQVVGHSGSAISTTINNGGWQGIHKFLRMGVCLYSNNRRFSLSEFVRSRRLHPRGAVGIRIMSSTGFAPRLCCQTPLV